MGIIPALRRGVLCYLGVGVLMKSLTLALPLETAWKLEKADLENFCKKFLTAFDGECNTPSSDGQSEITRQDDSNGLAAADLVREA